jgi:hypothetical protein
MKGRVEHLSEDIVVVGLDTCSYHIAFAYHLDRQGS